MVSEILIFSLTMLFTPLSLGDVKGDYADAGEPEVAANQLTPENQSESRSDVDVTRQIRQDIIADRALSLYAHNVKIITVGGKVTLRGPVRSKAEESQVVRFAQLVAGPAQVVDQLQITPGKKTKTY